MPPPRVFLLSPASCAGRRAEILMRDEASFPLALALKQPGGVPLGDVFTFLSGLYFRGKMAYAQRFASPPPGVGGTLVITAGSGLVSAETRVTMRELRRWAGIPVDVAEARYARPLSRDARALAAQLDESCEVVLLGSIATPKYLEPLMRAFGKRLRFPAEFAGRGDMSRGGLMLRCAREGTELTHVMPDEAPRHGSRPPKLAPRTRTR